MELDQAAPEQIDGMEIPCKTGESLWQNGFPLRVARYDHRRNRRMHRHDFFELVLVTSGHSLHVTPSGSCEISEGDVFLIRPGTAHSYQAVADFSLLNLLYAPELLPLHDMVKSPGYQALFVLEPEQHLPGGAFRHLRLDRETLARAASEADRLDKALSEAKPGCRFRALTIFMGIVSLLADYFTDLSAPRERPELFRLGRILGFLEQSYASPLTLPEIARHAAVSEATLYRLFRDGTGESPISRLNRIRIRHAGALLLNTRLSVSEIAAATGFTDSNYFSRCFRKFTGCSPRKFRETNGNPPPCRER
ncbi:MAG: helix-turn-helix domain-containing protein [Lentisphaeria bacterium]|nr:helix-turn-helix domain-containing protein [Lentisphaeria bacterium]